MRMSGSIEYMVYICPTALHTQIQLAMSQSFLRSSPPRQSGREWLVDRFLLRTDMKFGGNCAVMGCKELVMVAGRRATWALLSPSSLS